MDGMAPITREETHMEPDGMDLDGRLLSSTTQWFSGSMLIFQGAIIFLTRSRCLSTSMFMSGLSGNVALMVRNARMLRFLTETDMSELILPGV